MCLKCYTKQLRETESNAVISLVTHIVSSGVRKLYHNEEAYDTLFLEHYPRNGELEDDRVLSVSLVDEQGGLQVQLLRYEEEVNVSVGYLGLENLLRLLQHLDNGEFVPLHP